VHGAATFKARHDLVELTDERRDDGVAVARFVVRKAHRAASTIRSSNAPAP
jgi:hypothetical protein